MMVLELYLISMILIIYQWRLTYMPRILLGMPIFCDPSINSFWHRLRNGSVNLKFW